MATTIELKTDITGSVWKVLKQAGDHVDEEEPVLIMESMKMEVPVIATDAGVVREILVKEGQQVAKGQKIAEMGNSDADQVKLHFEIRRLGKPMDPARYLPPA